MKIIADLHIHSRYSRATSKQINIENLVKYARIKGVNLLGTGDFTHQLWLKELKENLVEDGSGILKDKSGFGFVLSSEISSIYKQGNKVRKIHNLIYAPEIAVAEQINDALRKRGVNLDSDGRPICGVHCPELVEIVKGIDERCEIVPAHIWTPWFSLFGSMSGFNRIKDCFQDQTKHIYALETGLSSDPAMNWRISELDDYTLMSNSDSHSFWPWRMGREANVFDLSELTYGNLFNAVNTKDTNKFLFTIEVDPSYGKYHINGHRNCGISMEPKESIKLHNICPKCGNRLTIGVLHRIEELSDRSEGFRPDNAIPFKSLIPLSEIIASIQGTGQLYSKRVNNQHEKLVSYFGSEFNVLLDASESELARIADSKLARAILMVRNGEVKIKPGFDGVYGQPVFDRDIDISSNKAEEYSRKQKSISDFN